MIFALPDSEETKVVGVVPIHSPLKMARFELRYKCCTGEKAANHLPCPRDSYRNSEADYG